MPDNRGPHFGPSWLLVYVGIAAIFTVGVFSVTMVLLVRLREIQANATLDRSQFFYIFLPTICTGSFIAWMAAKSLVDSYDAPSATRQSLPTSQAFSSSWPDGIFLTSALESFFQSLSLMMGNDQKLNVFKSSLAVGDWTAEELFYKATWTFVLVIALGIAYFKATTASLMKSKVCETNKH